MEIIRVEENPYETLIDGVMLKDLPDKNMRRKLVTLLNRLWGVERIFVNRENIRLAILEEQGEKVNLVGYFWKNRRTSSEELFFQTISLLFEYLDEINKGRGSA